MRAPAHRRRPNYAFRRLVAVMILATLAVVVWRSGVIGGLFGGDDRRAVAAKPSGGISRPTGREHPTPTTDPRTPAPINSAFPGLTTFRGNATRSYYGQGPLPANPEILWQYPTSGGMCSTSSNLGVTKTWCGMGWTGQPNVIEHDNGRIEIRFGAYDSHYHFLDGRTGQPMRADVVTGDLAKGSATSDPEGYPLYYGGSRDNYLRIIALDRKQPEVLWSLNADTSAPNPVWNDDWDGAPLILGDYMLEGSENSWFYVIKLNRRYDAAGLVQVDPRIVMLVPGYDEQLFADLPDEDVSIESSVAFHDGVVYFVNSGGLVQGWDIRDILRGGERHERIFRYWNGDDTDATIVIDNEGFLYVARHGERLGPRNDEVGDLVKLDPRKPNKPVVWDQKVAGGSREGPGGIWSTPALYRGRVYVTTNAGELIAFHQQTGERLWSKSLPGPTWSSPVPIDDQLLVGDCEGVLHNYDLSDPTKEPKELWQIDLGSCIEATPAVWKGMIWLGTRGGAIYAIGDAGRE